jgi:hypothetical protein
MSLVGERGALRETNEQRDPHVVAIVAERKSASSTSGIASTTR